MKENSSFKGYPFEVKELSKEEGGGYLVTFPDLPGCMSDGDTKEEAIKNAKDAFNAWMGANKEWKKPIPIPSKK
jgi:antitoxin HicB